MAILSTFVSSIFFYKLIHMLSFVSLQEKAKALKCLILRKYFQNFYLKKYYSNNTLFTIL